MGGSFAAKKKWEAWTMSQYPSSKHLLATFSLRLPMQENSTLELNTISRYWELECVYVRRTTDSQPRNYNYKSWPVGFLYNPSVVYSRLRTHLHPPLRTHTSSLSRERHPQTVQMAVPTVAYMPPLRQTDNGGCNHRQIHRDLTHSQAASGPALLACSFSQTNGSDE